jgi:outer membrane receptor protein involved in Fe transport
MRAACRIVFGLWVVLASAAAADAGQATPPPPPPPPTQNPPAGQNPPTEVRISETVVVSASKVEQELVNAPATISVIGERALKVSPSANYADLLRAVPGLNITQISARDVNVTSRSATGSLATQNWRWWTAEASIRTSSGSRCGTSCRPIWMR